MFFCPRELQLGRLVTKGREGEERHAVMITIGCVEHISLPPGNLVAGLDVAVEDTARGVIRPE